MMILRHFRLGVFGVILAGLAAPALAQAPAGASGDRRASAERAQPGHSRRVELPFPLNIRPAEDSRTAPAPRESEGPHPYREIRLQRASLDDSAARHAIRALRLSRFAEFG
jgi:hypothetical protein